MNNTSSSLDIDTPSLLGIPLTTHRLGNESTIPYEAIIAAISICFFRYTVKIQKDEPLILRWFFCALLAALTYARQSYELLVAVEIFSYMVPWLLVSSPLLFVLHPQSRGTRNNIVLRLLSIVTAALFSFFLSHGIFSSGVSILRWITPGFVVQTMEYLFPISEMKAAYKIMNELTMEPDNLRAMLQHLFFVTFHIQVGMGYLGIDFLRREQSRRNDLIRLDMREKNDDEQSEVPNNEIHSNNQNGKKTSKKTRDLMLERSRKFQAGAAPFIFATALPYMFQIIFYGNINQFAFTCVQDEIHRHVRIRQVFERDNHLTSVALDSAVSPDAYASSMNKVISTAYDIFNRKLFSLPKVLLLPGVMSRQPMLIVQVFPFIFLSDWLKASAVSVMTTKIEALQKDINDLTAIRSKVEAFDIKNAELLQRSGRGAAQFTERRWEELTVKIQSRRVVSDLISRSKGFFAFMQRNFVFTVLIDCALANLIAIGKIVPSEIFVFSRAIEDAVDMMLMRSRSEAELARMMTEIEKLSNLSKLLQDSKEPRLLRCHVSDEAIKDDGAKSQNYIILRNLHYSRGTATARADHLELGPGIYAVTGSNGSGKSTLFRILMSCHTNEKSIDLPPSINLLTPAEPLTESDDIIRESCCLADDDEEYGEENYHDAEDCAATTDESDRELSNTSSLVSPGHHKPKLSITMPSSHVVEISQNFYWPLYSKPIDWIFQNHVTTIWNSADLEKRVRKVAEELHSLEFFQAPHVQMDSTETDKTTIEIEERVSDATTAEATIHRIMTELQEEKEDWFSDLSGGQKSKVELVRSVFLRERCPDVLLVDETMAPLDPASKELVMTKLKQFCSNSIILVIYHTDVGQGKQINGKKIDCVPSNDFFNKNVHLANGIVHLRETC